MSDIDPRDREWLELILWLRDNRMVARVPKRGSPYFQRAHNRAHQAVLDAEKAAGK